MAQSGTAAHHTLGLDVGRFLAVSAVLFYHIGFKVFAGHDRAFTGLTLHDRLGIAAHLPPWTLETWWGWVGIQVLFVISGLAIAGSLDRAAPVEFLVSRIRRLAPAMLVCATLIAVVDLTFADLPFALVLKLWLKSVTFFPVGPWLSGQFWILPVQIAFYGLVWLLVLARAPQRVELLAWALCLACVAYWAAIYFGGRVDHHERITRLLLLGHGCYFALGILLARIQSKGLSVSRLVLATLCIATAWFQIHWTASAEELGYGLANQAIVPFCIWLTAVAAISASLFWKPRAVAAATRPGRYSDLIGQASYPLYLLQANLGGAVLVVAISHGVRDGLALVVAYAVCVAVALMVALVVEPLHRGRIGAVVTPSAASE